MTIAEYWCTNIIPVCDEYNPYSYPQPLVSTLTIDEPEYGGGGGGGGTTNDNNDNVDGYETICPNSVKFKNVISVDPINGIGEWQVAGVSGLHMNIVDVETGQLVPISIPTMYFGLPIKLSSGVFISSSQASDYVAQAVEFAENEVMFYYHMGGSLNSSGMSIKYRNALQQFMLTKFGSACLSPGTFTETIPVTKAVYSGLFGLNCL